MSRIPRFVAYPAEFEKALETVRFEGDRIVSLEDRYTAEMVAEIERFVAEYGPKLGLDLRSR